MTKLARTLGALGSLLLLVTAAFHGSGYMQVSEAIAPSEAPDFLKRAVPILWLHFSLHLTLLGAVGVFGAFFAGTAGRAIFAFLAVAAAVDAVVIFMAAGLFAGVVLPGVAALCFAVAAALYGLQRDALNAAGF